MFNDPHNTHTVYVYISFNQIGLFLDWLYEFRSIFWQCVNMYTFLITGFLWSNYGTISTLAPGKFFLPSPLAYTFTSFSLPLSYYLNLNIAA